MKILVYTDGACSGNPGPGGWGALVIYRPDSNSDLSPNSSSASSLQDFRIVELGGHHPQTTNNRMEMTAVIEALRALRDLTWAGGEAPNRPPVEIRTDSKYVIDGITSWIKNWKKNGFRNAQKEPVKNQELWMELDQLTEKFQIKWSYVPGHKGFHGNERCDEIAVQYTRGQAPSLYNGPLLDYSIPARDLFVEIR